MPQPLQTHNKKTIISTDLESTTFKCYQTAFALVINTAGKRY